MSVETADLWGVMAAHTLVAGGGSARTYIPFGRVSSPVRPEAATAWNELDGVWSVDQTGEPLGWRPVERSESVWQLRLDDDELLVSRGREGDGHTDWWVSLVQDGERVVDDHRVRVGADGELGEALAAVLTAVR